MRRFKILVFVFLAILSVSTLKAQQYDTVWTKYFEVGEGFSFIKFHPTQSTIIAAGAKIYVLNISDGSAIDTLSGSGAINISKSGAYLDIGKDIYNGNTYEKISTLTPYYGANSISISYSDSVLALGAKGRVILYSLPSGEMIKQIIVGDTLTGKDIKDLVFAPNGSELCYRTYTDNGTSEPGTIHFIDVAHDSIESASFESGNIEAYPVTYSNDGRYILASPPLYIDNPNKYEYLVIDAATKTLLYDKMPTGSYNPSDGAFFSKNGAYVISTNQESTSIRILNFAEKNLVASITTVSGGTGLIDIDKNNEYIINASYPWALYHTPNPLGIDKGEIFDNENYIFPNPTKAEVNIKTSFSTLASLNYKFSDFSGIEYNAPLIKESSDTKTFNVQDLPNGAYFLRLSNNNSTLSYKFIVNK